MPTVTKSWWTIRLATAAKGRVPHPLGYPGSPAESARGVRKSTVDVDYKCFISIVKTSGGCLESLGNKSGNPRDSRLVFDLVWTGILKIESQRLGMFALKKAETLEDPQ
ncbi:MAG: hypothetical protein P4L87_23230 [Formivibrio sp.]|nr:hypothetical protein [Formivibrio sp.]